jgi:hypothetical protein
MNFSNISSNSMQQSNTFTDKYIGYKLDTLEVISKVKAEINTGKSNQKMDKDMIDISEAGRKALIQKPSNLKGFGEDVSIKKLSSTSSFGYFNDFEKTLSSLCSNDTVSLDFTTENYFEVKVDALKQRFGEENGVQSDSFSRYTNKMAATYNLMSETIDEKYADASREKEYYIAEDGGLKELTKEKEKEMLNKAYESHSEFMAGSTELWNTLKNEYFYKMNYQNEENIASDKEEEHQDNTVIESEKGEIKNSAYKAFMNAIGKDNINMLSNAVGSWNHLKLNLGVSDSELSKLNQIWDYYANKSN